ncbi:hypothetical protein ID854_13960 [Xenorhabdus sp. M]|uniref:Uncharacterized protein n=1 Tax=Xenorhabdus szentirmaii TaxID=290112 RepID=A0AAW3YWZ1_9GAMM|nr:hypothetical protein [Xenorhabdus sp. M]MBD2801529.1 hypothetical protein [Xenorhabdus sp. M]
MRIKILLFIITIFISTNSFSEENVCEKFNLISETEAELINASTSGYKVIGKGRAYFYTSPNVNCKNDNVFIIKNDLVNAYSVYGDFTSIMYLDKNQNLIQGWVQSSRLIPTGTGIGPSDENK